VCRHFGHQRRRQFGLRCNQLRAGPRWNDEANSRFKASFSYVYRC
jgi:hypothetical protein